jgi:hypothetical protein
LHYESNADIIVTSKVDLMQMKASFRKKVNSLFAGILMDMQCW